MQRDAEKTRRDEVGATVGELWAWIFRGAWSLILLHSRVDSLRVFFFKFRQKCGSGRQDISPVDESLGDCIYTLFQY